MADLISTFLTLEDLATIRAAIEPTLASVSGTDAEQPLPDSLIQSPIYLGEAEAWVLGKLPDAATRTGLEAVQVKNAVIWYAASLLAGFTPNFQRESFGDYSYTAAPRDLGALSTALRVRAINALTRLGAPWRPGFVGMTLADGERGQ